MKTVQQISIESTAGYTAVCVRVHVNDCMVFMRDYEDFAAALAAVPALHEKYGQEEA